jgi:hypothetical protein
MMPCSAEPTSPLPANQSTSQLVRQAASQLLKKHETTTESIAVFLIDVITLQQLQNRDNDNK